MGLFIFSLFFVCEKSEEVPGVYLETLGSFERFGCLDSPGPRPPLVFFLASRQKPNRTSEHPNPTTKMGGEFTYQPKWDQPKRF